MASTHDGDLYVKGQFRAKTLIPPDGSITNDSVQDAAGIDASKLEHQHALEYRQDDGSDVVAATAPLHVVRGTDGEAIEVEVVCQTAPTGGDKEFTVDVQKASEASPSPASILQSVITVDNTISDYEIVQGTIDSGTLADGDTLLIVITPSGSTGSQGQGLIVTTNIREDAT